MNDTTPSNSPYRVAIFGAGPSGFYIAQALLKDKDLDVRVDLFDRLPAPYGLVRYGVAPDHQKIKNVTNVYAKVAADPRMRFFGNVGFGRDITLDELKRHYHQVAFTTGAQTDRKLGIPGEDLANSHPATEFVAWYNGHPDYKDLKFDLSCERAMVVGVGNVAIDVARILVRTQEELKQTDIADYALEALAQSKIKEVLLVGRRGPAQAAFTNKEIEELGQMAGADAVTLPEEVDLGELTKKYMEENPDRQTDLKVQLLQSYAEPKAEPKEKRVIVRFLLSPTELVDDGTGKVGGAKFVKNELFVSKDGSLRPRASENTEEAELGLVFRSVGYRGVQLPGVPFREDWGTIPNQDGRVLEAPDGAPVTGLYTAGWIKRGPSGVIGTNRPCSVETVTAMMEDKAAGKTFTPDQTDPASVVGLLESKGVRWLSFEGWQKVDQAEIERGQACGRPRVKICDADEMLTVG